MRRRRSRSPDAAHAPAEAAFALGILGWSTAVAGSVDEGIDLYQQGLAIAEELGGVEGIALGHANLAALLDRVGRSAASLSAARDGFAIAQRFGVTRTYGGELLGHVAKASFDLGLWDDAVAAAEQGLALDPVGPSAIWLHINHARVDSNRGRFADAESHIAAAGDITAGADRYRAQLLTATAELGAWQGRLHAVRAIVDAALAGLDDGVPLDPAIGWLAWHALRAEAAAAAEARSRHDDQARAEIDRRVSPIVERLVRAASHPAAASDDPRVGAVAALCRGELGRIADSSDPATWDDAASAWMRLERPAPAAYARFRSAEATLRGRGDRATAATNVRSAHATAVKLDAAPLRDEIEALARHARIDLDVAAPQDRRDLLGLTEREAEVIRLVAAGRSNQQIADELFITRKTASVHVSNILGKLGAANRVEAAAIAQRLGLGEAPDR